MVLLLATHVGMSQAPNSGTGRDEGDDQGDGDEEVEDLLDILAQSRVVRTFVNMGVLATVPVRNPKRENSTTTELYQEDQNWLGCQYLGC